MLSSLLREIIKATQPLGSAVERNGECSERATQENSTTLLSSDGTGFGQQIRIKVPIFWEANSAQRPRADMLSASTEAYEIYLK